MLDYLNNIIFILSQAEPLMTFKREISVGDLLTVITILVSLITYIWSRHAEAKLRRATFIQEYTNQFYASPEVVRIFFDLDYSKFKFTADILGTEKEIQLVQLLDLFNSIGFNWANGVIKLKDIDETTLGYAIVRMQENSEVKSYLKHVDDYSATTNTNVVAFAHFRRLGKELCEATIEKSEITVAPEAPNSVKAGKLLRLWQKLKRLRKKGKKKSDT